MQQRAIDKYSRLVSAGSKVIHEQGFQQTVLSDIARQAKVPKGSIYYYFKTKEDIVASVMQERVDHIKELFKKWQSLAGPQKRLFALVDLWLEDREIDSQYGCPIGSLCYELAKNNDDLSLMAAEPLKQLTTWSEKQFREIGKTPKQASDLGLHLVSALQGVSLLANAFRDPAIIAREAQQLKSWIKTL